MPIYAMRCTSESAHDKTDKLFIYTFESPSHVYDVGDTVAVAIEGTRTEEGGGGTVVASALVP